jgi:hypothetical protein
MRRIPLLLAVAVVLALTAAPAAFAQADDQNCADFASQAAAQAHLRADPQDPDGLDALPGPADGNDDRTAGGHGDGIACEGLPGPFDREPVFAGSPAPAPPTTVAPTPAAPTTTVGGPLPFTGPRDTQLPLGAGLLVVGAAIVAFARYRPRHARR